MKRKPLQVNMHVREPSVVEVTVEDRVQLDHLTPAPHGYLAERHGRLLDPGTTGLSLAPGHYFFKTLSEAHLRVVTGGVTAGITAQKTKDGPVPDPPKPGGPGLAGDDAPGEPPSFTVEELTHETGGAA